MGLDLGDKRIGVAVSDPMGWTAQGVEVIVSKGSREADIKKIAEAARKYEVERIVVGLPINMNGSSGQRAEKIKTFANRLSGALHLPVELWDERLSTAEAEKLLIKADLSRSRRRQVIDKMAAALILQGYLDSRSRKTSPGS
ncbi:Holliday junction resolvase RuvX [Pelotomaculum terephthalicicum JT]|uniref:Holliday junction resolvase RuvX n=1 Tax=Pelotomaculum TaxID=191373 RepID=UPI0009D4B751|nr:MULTISPECIES: Holliday junction resolvase RuvX [Pelotomaculum]MCG9969080.1 Holliday junction resolvase RuvX [Pelotomaculum terephthalicicum JT]OPX87400.1 MAG: putative Holliday junction resolvase [Pelotomaculum sp. PtaB.Bin117]OPY60905.1 MAG: putative Holliday junction resolvase [Pelotomaculum sp. PtaU1.Bin065]